MSKVDFAACYRTLDLAFGAPESDIRRAYKLLVNVWHPDRFQHDQTLRQAAEEKLKAINDAFDRLCSVGFTAPPAAVEVTAIPSPSPRSPRKRNAGGARVPSLSSLLETGQRHARRDRDGEAIAAFTHAATLYPSSYEACYELAVALACRNQDDQLLQADQAAYQAVRLGPDRPETKALLECKNRWSPTGPAAAARSVYEERLALDPTNARLWANFGYLLYCIVADRRPARNAFARSTQLDPNNWEVWFRLGLSLSPEEVSMRNACRENLRRLGRAGEAVMIQSLVPVGTRLRQWFRGQR